MSKTVKNILFGLYALALVGAPVLLSIQKQSIAYLCLLALTVPTIALAAVWSVRDEKKK